MLLGAVLLLGPAGLGLHAAPAAQAASQLDEAAAALAGPGVWRGEGFEGLTEETVELMRARYARAGTPVRVALLTDTEVPGYDTSGLARELAQKVGEPGLYIVHAEWPNPTEDYPNSADGYYATGIGFTDDQLSDEEFAHIGIGDGSFLLGVADAMDQDLSAQIPTEFGEGRFLVDPAVTEVFPELSTELLETTFAGLPQVRIALVSGFGGDQDAVAAAMSENLGEGGAMALIQWYDDDFSVAIGTGSGLPTIDSLEAVVAGSGIAEVTPAELPGGLARLALALGPPITDVARDGLAGSPLFVHPTASDGATTEAQLDAYAASLAGADPPVEVAFLPSDVAEAHLGLDALIDSSAVAAGIAGDGGGSGNLVVYLIDPEYRRVDWVSAVGDEEFRTATQLSRAAGDSYVSATLDSLIQQLGLDRPEVPQESADDGADGADGGGGSGSGGGGAAENDADTGSPGLPAGLPAVAALAAVVVIALLAAVRLTVRHRGGLLTRRAKTAEAARRRLAAMPPQQRAAELARARELAAANQRQLERLAARLAERQVPAALGSGSGADRLRAVLSEYERLLEANDRVASVPEAREISDDLARAGSRLLLVPATLPGRR
ncbi:hypothetical protein [Streptomyces aidingensis]|uniref:hypothetical protein n=1 Tax=Streptomyces aidingensis TaxID=910347 RepID=UPI000B840F32|nr:hypothetical protein [Streptomyces aidingensis]